MSIEQKIVYAGLNRVTDDRVVLKDAFEYWDKNFSNSLFDIVDTTSKLVSYLGLNGNEKKVLMIAMHAASNKSEIELDDVPGFLLGGDVSGVSTEMSETQEAQKVSEKSKTKNNYTPHYLITHGFVKGIVDGVSREGSEAFSEVDEILRDEGLPDVTKESAKLIAEHGFNEQMVLTSIGKDECSDLAHALYLLVIDVIGPVALDVIVTQVIGELLQSSMASRFDPRSLI